MIVAVPSGASPLFSSGAEFAGVDCSLASPRAGAIKVTPGRLAQLVERLLYTQDVGGSSPSPPTSLRAYGASADKPTLIAKAVNDFADQDKHPSAAKAAADVVRKRCPQPGFAVTPIP
jgi:hypothetical protein